MLSRRSESIEKSGESKSQVSNLLLQLTTDFPILESGTDIEDGFFFENRPVRCAKEIMPYARDITMDTSDCRYNGRRDLS